MSEEKQRTTPSYIPPEVAARRKPRPERDYVPVLETRRPLEGEINCAGCEHLGNFNDEHKRGFCMLRRSCVSTWHPARCKLFTPLVREKKIKVAWKGVAYGSAE